MQAAAEMLSEDSSGNKSLTKCAIGVPLQYMNTVVELPEFIRRAQKLLRDTERDRLITYLAANPLAGVVLEGTSGIRKIRWKREGTGKSGGVRVIYYYHDERYPLFLLTVFGKSEQSNLRKAERNMLAKLARQLLATYQQGRAR